MRTVSSQELLLLLLLRKLKTYPLSALPPPLSHPRMFTQPSAPSPLYPFSAPPSNCQNNALKPCQNMFLPCCVLFVAQLCHPITPLPPPGATQASHCDAEPVSPPGLCSCLTCCRECCSQGSDPAPLSA